MGLTWNPDFIKSAAGMAQAGQVAFSLIGGVVNIFGGSGLLGFAFWSTFFISGVLLLAHVCNMAQSIEAGFPYFTKVELLYAAVWGVIFLVGSILSTINFAIAVVSRRDARVCGIYRTHAGFVVTVKPNCGLRGLATDPKPWFGTSSFHNHTNCPNHSLG